MVRIDLNCDLGESFGSYKIGQDKEILKYISSANVACGFHAGDYNVMYETVKIARDNNVAIGAHPGLNDIAGFGRRYIEMTEREIYHLVLYQLGALEAFVRVQKGYFQHVKPHGALYHMAATDKRIATAVVEAIVDYNNELIVFGLAGSELIKVGKSRGLKVAEEVFADRTYQADGSLTPRSQTNAVIESEEMAMKQVMQMIETNTVTSTDGNVIPIQADTICVHGDNEQALSFVKKLKELLMKNGIEIAPIGGRK